MINCVIIDDIQNSIDLLKNHMKNKSELVLIATFTNPLEGLKFLENNKIDLVFIDMEMPDMNGLEFIESLRSKMGVKIPKFVFTTGDVKYALSCYEHGVRDYLVKPIGFKKFNMSVDRIIDDLNPSPILSSKSRGFCIVDVSGIKTKINFKDIAYIESLSNYVQVFCDKKKYLVHKSMNSIGEMLPSEDFVRIHKSYIVSVDHIVNYKGSQLTVLVDEELEEIPIGAKYRDNLNRNLEV